MVLQCSKSSPQTLKLREITGKDDYTGLAFVGVRAQESATRAGEYENYGKNKKDSTAITLSLSGLPQRWLYIYANNILINQAYKKGSGRLYLLPDGRRQSKFYGARQLPAGTDRACRAYGTAMHGLLLPLKNMSRAVVERGKMEVSYR